MRQVQCMHTEILMPLMGEAAGPSSLDKHQNSAQVPCCISQQKVNNEQLLTQFIHDRLAK